VEAAAAKPAPRAKRSRTLFPTIALGAAATLLMGAAVAAWVTSEKQQGDANAGAMQASASAEAPAAPAVNVAELSRSFPEATLRAARDAQGKWILSGRIATEDARHRLRDAVAALKVPVDVRVMLDAERTAAVVGFVEKHRATGETELNARQGNAGALRITGATTTAASVASLTEAAHRDLADAEPIEVAILDRSQVAARFEERLRATGLAPKFKTIRTDPQMELQAVLSSAEVRTWETLFADFTREWGSVLTITAQVQHERDEIEARNETIVAGPLPYIDTTNGKSIAPGGVLEGRTQVSIRNGELLFSDGLRMRYAN
jgi:type III secretion system YscD/HrpQ family protein